MLDLKELERRLDEALEKETSESLTCWILSQRTDNLNNFLGVGSIQNFSVNPWVFTSNIVVNEHYNHKNGNDPSEKLALAA